MMSFPQHKSRPQHPYVVTSTKRSRGHDILLRTSEPCEMLKRDFVGKMAARPEIIIQVYESLLCFAVLFLELIT